MRKAIIRSLALLPLLIYLVSSMVCGGGCVVCGPWMRGCVDAWCAVCGVRFQLVLGPAASLMAMGSHHDGHGLPS